MQLKEEFHVPDERVFHNKKVKCISMLKGCNSFAAGSEKDICIIE